MKGIFVVARNQTEILEIPEPEPGPYEALVEVRACGICNSTDWKIIEGEFVSGTFPILLGHESAGQVVHVGDQVRSFRMGDMVLRATLRDEHVPFPGGRSCWGGFVEKAIVTDVWAQEGVAYNAFPHPQQIVPPQVPAAQAAALITLKETLSCLENSDVGADHSLAIVGTGPVAQALTLLAGLAGIRPLVVFGRRPVWADRFARLGVDAYVAGDDVPPEVRAILDGGGFDRAIEAVGARAALSRCLQVVKPEGRVNLYGIAPESEPYLPAEESDPRVFRSRVAEAEAHDRLLNWIEQGQIDLADWVSHEVHWTDYRRGFDMIKLTDQVSHKRANKVVLTF
jgi:threonine dehydrogenase-like Zn-dependent dehydrogenase